MDYLDPRKRRAYNLRLIVGYILVAIVIGLGTVIIVYGANGYGINRKTGQIIQNALLFSDSNPSGAEIYLNGKDQNTQTSARLILPTGNYTLALKKDGYHDWSRQFTLNEQSVARYVYPFLFPLEPRVADIKSYQSAPSLTTQSPDRRWLLVGSNELSSKSLVFDMYDTNTLDRTAPVVEQISIPSSVLTSYSAKSRIKAVEWSSDNNHLLLSHSYSGKIEFIVFDRSNPSRSLNVNRIFKLNPSQVSLFDKKTGQLYLYDAARGSLQLGDTTSGNLTTVISKNLLAYKPFGRNLIAYITNAGQPESRVQARIWNSGTTYKLSELSAGTKYMVDLAQFQGNFYYVVGSDTSDRINIYKNPLDNIKNPSIAKALGLLSMHIDNLQKVSFSTNARFVTGQSGQNFAVYDIETGETYHYSVEEHLTDNLSWMDGHRLIGQTGGQILVMDYDGTNKQLLGSTLEPFGGLFSRDFNHLLAVNKSKSGKIILQDIDMRAGNDLPKP
jgi:hypothetical protein